MSTTLAMVDWNCMGVSGGLMMVQALLSIE
jgi:hypothetical protein